MSRPGDLRSRLISLDASAPQHLRDVLIRDQAGRDTIASELLHYGDQARFDWADIIDTLTMHPDARRRVQLLAEIDAG